MGIVASQSLKRIVAIAALVTGLAQVAGCASALSREALNQISPEVSPHEVLDNPGRFRGRVILVAGHLIRIENRKDGTLLEVLGYPANDRGVPDLSEPALGRFLLLYPGFLDALVYRPGRQIVAVGRIMGQRSVTVGEALRVEPLLHPLELRLLPEQPRYYPPFQIGFGLMFGF